VGDGVLVGIGSIILDGAVIGEESLIGAGTLVAPGKKIPPGSLVLGSPGKAVRALSPQKRALLKTLAEKYTRLAAYYLEHKIKG
jgi:carbonic anhydrase/acetyltransferase-like protein (isoleucine patch superfamily)